MQEPSNLHPVSAFWTLLFLWLGYYYLWPSLAFPRAPKLIQRKNVDIIIKKNKNSTSFIAKPSGNPGNACILITGASQGIGRELAKLYSHLGAKHIVIASRNVEHLEQVARECCQIGANQVHVVPFDASQEPTSTELLIKETLLLTDNLLDIIILNHIKPCYVPMLQATDPTGLARDCAKINYIAYVDLATRAIPYLDKTARLRWKTDGTIQKSQIVAVSSLAGKLPLPNVHAYGASKCAVNGWFADLRAELLASPLYKNSITVTTCLLSAIDTEGFRDSAAKENPTVLSIAARAEDAAYHIIDSSRKHAQPGAITIATQGDTYFPAYIGIMPLLAAIFPRFAGWVVDVAHRTGKEQELAEKQQRLEGVAPWAIPIRK